MIAKGNIKKAEIRARVFRAATGEWEDLGTISKLKVNIFNKIITNIKKIWQQY